MTKAQLEKQLRKCEKLLKKYTKCSACNGKGKRTYPGARDKPRDCYACHSSGTISCELSAYWIDRKALK